MIRTPGQWGFASRDYSPNVAISIVHGAHSVKFGLGYNRYVKNQQIQGRTNGDFTFNDSVNSSGVPTSQLSGRLLRRPSARLRQRLQPAPVSGHPPLCKQHAHGLRMDNWHISRQLSCNMACAMTRSPHLLERSNRLANFDPANYLATLAPTINADGSLNPSGPGFQNINGTPFYLNGMGPRRPVRCAARAV